MLAQLGDIDVHRASVEVVVVNPDGLEGEVALEDNVDVGAEQREQLALLGGELGDFVFKHEHLLLGVEGEFAYLVHCHLFAFLAFYAAQDGLDAEHEFFHREGLGDIVVGADFEAFEDVFLERFCGKEDDGHLGIDGAYLLSQGKAVFLRHHHVKDADVILAFEEGFVSVLAIGIEVGVEPFGLEVFTQEHTEIFIVFAK